jgi:MFS family permease
MYQIENLRSLITSREPLSRRLRAPQVSRNVVLLGLTSLFTDISAEMVATVLPLYLIYTLGLSPLQFGVIDGVYQGATALVRLGGGYVADRSRRYKEVAAFGYALSAICKPAFLVAGSTFGALTAIILVDRSGKGIRTAPRDALISLSTRRESLATAFGVHRALDTAGAMLGPLLAFALLALVPSAFDSIFVVSFCIALIGLGILLFFVENEPAREDPEASPNAGVDEQAVAEKVSLRAAGKLVADRGFRRLLLAGSVLAVATLSDGFIYLSVQRHLDLDAILIPLLFVGTALVYMVLAVPVGWLADRYGRGRLFVAGYGLLLVVYAALFLPSLGIAELFLLLFLLGTYYAATDGVLMALASEILPSALRGSGLALLVTATSMARLVASILFGTLWTWLGAETALVAFAVGLAVAMVVGALALRVTREKGRQPALS